MLQYQFMQIFFTIFIRVFVQHSPDWLKFRYCTNGLICLRSAIFCFFVVQYSGRSTFPNHIDAICEIGTYCENPETSCFITYENGGELNYLIRDIMEGYAAILTFNVTKVTFANKPVTCSPLTKTG